MRTQYILSLALLLAICLSPSHAYYELYRPGYHFSPPKNWMNDPNGLVYYDGLHHLYYQYNPYDNVWGNMTWGHAVSSDLVHWMNLPDAITQYKDIMIYSGSVIVDVNNTSGFCDHRESGCMIAYYTQQNDAFTNEAQGMAYSNNNGFTYTEYAKNPIIDVGLSGFRDPKVSWYEPERKWIMVVAKADLHQISLYSSENLVKWTHMSDFGPDGSVVGVWEDPDIFPMTVEGEDTERWVLTHSVASYETVYHIGWFNGTHFINNETLGETLLLSVGLDFSEAVTYNNEPTGRRLLMGWLGNDIYSKTTPTTVWRGQQSLLREFILRRYPEGLRIAQQVIDEYQMLRTSQQHYGNIKLTENKDTFPLQSGTQVELIAEFAYPNQTDDVPYKFGFTVFTGPDQMTVIGYDMTEGSLFIDRSNSGITNFSSQYTDVTSFPMAPVNGTIQLHIFIDQSTIEVFGNDGKITITNLVYPDPAQDKIYAFTLGGSVTLNSVDSWLIQSIWHNATTTETETTGTTKTHTRPRSRQIDDFDIIQI